MAQQTAVRKLINYITERGFELEYEMEMSFLDLEEEQIEDAVIYGLDEDGHTGDWKISVAENYYIKTYTK